MGIASLYRKMYYSVFSSDKINRRKVRELLSVKIQSPFDSHEIITFGDFIMSTGITEYEILKVAESYGIALPSEAVDISGNHALEYLLYHGKNFHYSYVDEATNQINHVSLAELDGAHVIKDIPLIPQSHLSNIINRYGTQNESFRTFFGHSSEFSVCEHLRTSGVETYLPVDSNTESYDLICNRAQFKEIFGRDLPPWDNNNDFGLLQVKSTTMINDPTENYTCNTLEHFHNNPDIPVICSDKIHDALVDSVGEKNIISFSELGINNEMLEEYIKREFDLLKDLVPTDQLDVVTGLDASQFSDALSNSVDVTFHIPIVAMLLRGGISTYKNYRLYKVGNINLSQASWNVGKEVGKTLVISGTTVALTGLAAETVGISASEATNSVTESILSDNLDFDWDAFGDLAVYVGILVGIGWCVKKVWNFFAGDPLENYKTMIKKKQNYLISLQGVFERNKDLICQALKSSDYENVCKEICMTENRMKELEIQKVKSLVFFVLEYKKELLDNVRNGYDKYVKSVEPVFEKLHSMIDVLVHCQAEDVKLTKLIGVVKERYGNQEQQVAKVLGKIKDYEGLASVVSAVVSFEMKNLLSKINVSNIYELSNVVYTIEQSDLEIEKEYNRLKANGDIA